MYEKYEKPQFSACLLYFDDTHSQELALRILNSIRKYDFYPPKLIFAGNLTNNRYIKFHIDREDMFERAYSDKDVLTIELCSSQKNKATGFWKLLITKAFNNEPALPRSKKEMQWNTLHLSFTYDKLTDEEFCARYKKCVKTLIELLHPFFARMDDMAVSVDMALERNPPDGFARTQPTEYGMVNAIYWGNYYGPDYCKKYFPPDITCCDAAVWEPLGDGMFFSLSKDIKDFCTPKGLKNRKILTEKLGIQPIHPEAIYTMEQINMMIN